MVIKVFAQTMATHIPELQDTRPPEFDQPNEDKQTSTVNF